MILMCMHATGGDKAEQMAGAAGFFQGVDKAGHGSTSGHAAILNGGGDAWQFLHDDAARADIQVPDFGIAHLAVGQANIFPAGAQEAAGTIFPQRIKNRGVGLLDCVI
ncbi:hypothetical protein AA14337_2122 [Acetobacter malorum DSM 14337]|uniref:Uncharacterized protein n=1 Tax=Acetobacter malorum DSM 14337 TaxID=1307910 RepID=A0ABQ0PUK2_9PROT|nr:hypothetical protein AA14337_2122 [Acetobacter malorum DSM 14337]